MNFEIIIGLEIHVQINTKSKLFSPSDNSFSLNQNSHVSPFDMAFPGTLPVVNEEVVKKALQLANAFHMEIANKLYFDRKNYFYSDLPKGYQITQYFHPIGKEGYLLLNNKKYPIKEIHLEEDSAKQIHKNEKTYIDFNRAGKPLIEIVTDPIFHNEKEASEFVRKIRSIIYYLDISEARLEKGSLRCDVNVSLKPYGSLSKTNKVEIKNINSFVNMENAISLGIQRQSKLLYLGKEIKKETYRYDDDRKENILMREKEDMIDYRYFEEANIPPIVLSEEFIQDAINDSSELEEARVTKLKALNLHDEDIESLLVDKELYDFFMAIISDGTNPSLAFKWIKEEKKLIEENQLDIASFQEFILLIEKEKISHQLAKEILLEMCKSKKAPTTIYKQKCLILISNHKEILAMINMVADKNPQAIIDYKNGKERAINYLLGEVNKIAKGNIDQSLTYKLILEEMQRR